VKRTLFTLLLALLALLALSLLALFTLWRQEGVTPRQLPSAVGLATGLGAKLACSGRYLSGFDWARIESDVAQYSEATRMLRYSELDPAGVSARLPAVPAAVARYREGLGCTLEFDGTHTLDRVDVPAFPADPQDPWPRGAGIGMPVPALQSVAAEMVVSDNAAGLDTRALLLVYRGRIAAEAYGPGITRKTPLLGWSMGKSVTAMMVGRLEAMGLASVGEQALFAPWRDDERAQVSLQDLLQMSSGLAFDEEYVPGSDSVHMLFMSPSAASVAMEKPLVHAPGSHFSYSSGTTNLLSRLVFERVGRTPQAQADFFFHEFVEPMQLEGTILEPDQSGVYVGSSYVYAPARDWARFGLVMLDGGRINGQRLLEPDWVRRATAPNRSDNDPRYGYQFWLNDGGAELRWPSLPRDAYAMLGNRKQVVMIVPSRQAVIVRLGWSPGDYPEDSNFARLLEALP